MLRSLSLLLLCLFYTVSAQAQETRYVSDEVFVVLHTGPGNDYRWAAKLTPGTRMTLESTSDDGDWAEVTTSRGTSGWVKTEFLTTNAPAQVQLPAAQAKAQTLADKNAELSAQLENLSAEKAALLERIENAEANLSNTTEELSNIKTISGNAVQLDSDNRRLIEETENLRSEVTMLETENLRLQDKLGSDDFLNGALAVLMGVFITLVVPRLWPKRRKSSSWA